MFGGSDMATDKTLTLARRLVFYPLAVISLIWQAVMLLGHMMSWWDYGPSVSQVVDIHLAMSITNLVTGSVLLGLGWRTWLGWTLVFQILLCLLSASAAIDHADIWLVTDNDHLADWEKHPQWVGYAFNGLAGLFGAGLVAVMVIRKPRRPTGAGA